MTEAVSHLVARMQSRLKDEDMEWLLDQSTAKEKARDQEGITGFCGFKWPRAQELGWWPE
jgi:hypothetical protein